MKSLTQARRDRKRRLPRVGRETSDHFDFQGGLNLIESPLTVKPGQCQSALNYEMGFAGGYRRVGGYLPFDGTANAEGDYAILPYGATVDPALSNGDIINGGSSSALATLLTYTTDGGFGVNEYLHNQEYENAYWVNNDFTITDDDLAWTNGVIPTLSKWERTGATTPYLLPVGNTIITGHVLHLQGYVKPTGGASFFNVIQSGALPTFLGGHTLSVSWNLDTMQASPNAAVADSGIELVSDGVYRFWVTTKLCTLNSAGFGIGIAASISIGEYFHMSGLMLVIGTDPVPSGGFGFVNTTSSTKSVKSGNLVLGPVSGGPFTDDEDLDVLSTVFGQAVGVDTVNSESDPTLDAQYAALAIVAAGAAASAPVGSGPVRGVWLHEGTVYAFRDNAGATECNMWKSTGSGWVQITFNDVVHFDAGDGTEPAEGDTLDGVTSTASALIKRVVKTSGTWGIDAAGYFVLGTVTSGPYTNNEVLNVSAARVADADGASAVPTLTAGGRYEFRSHNFYGHSDSYRMYGVDGKNYAFEYDKDEGVFTQIETGMTVDTPTHLAVHNGHLHLAFRGGSHQLSGDGSPLSWTVITGASEIGVGDEITGYNEEVGNSLFIFTRDSTFVLQGNTRANFSLDEFNINAGSHEWSLQRIGMGCYFDDRGFTTLLQTQRSGSVNFQENAVSELIQPLVLDLIKNTQVKCSHLIRNQNIYRCYFDDGRVVSIGFDGHKVSGHMPLEFPFVANVACSEEDTTGGERIFVGANDGFVYELETGTSFDGYDINVFMRTVIYHSNSPGRFKKYHQARLDATLPGALTMVGQIEYDFHDDAFNLADELDFSTSEAGGYWDDFSWDSFVWDQPTSGIPQQKLEGEGVNAAVYLRSTSSSDESHTLRGITLQWSPRRDDRRN